MEFEIIGYSYDYYFEGKYVGTAPAAAKDREVFGYQGRKTIILENDLILKKKKVLKGSKVIQELIPICGKII